MNSKLDNKEFFIEASKMAESVFNPIRAIVDHWEIPKSTEKRQVIPLSIGDPTVFGNLRVPKNIEDEMIRVIKSGKCNGYGLSFGTQDARVAIAKKYSTNKHPVTSNDVVIASGASGALAIVLPTIANAGDNILLPKPGFSLYRTLCETYGIECGFYNLIPDRQWEIDLEQCSSLVDSKTRAILVNNPSNPCGSNFTDKHIQNIIDFAEKYQLPIVADEIYADMVFSDSKYYSFASLSENVPILSIGGLAKMYLVPGWRVGWCVLHDRQNRLKKFRGPLVKMTQLILGCNSLVQAAIPHILEETDASYYSNLMKTLEENAMFSYNTLQNIKGLTPIKPQGAMYIMVKIDIQQFKDDIKDDVEFCRQLLNDEYVFVLPGSCFGAPDFFRIVICAPIPQLSEAFNRLKLFVDKKLKK